MTIEIRGEDVLAAITAMETLLNGGDLEEQAGAILLARTRKRFLAKQDPDGKAWVPSASGLRREALGGPGTLFKTGRLFHSIQFFKRDGGFGLGTDVPYASYHQDGTGKGGVQRRFIGASDEDISVICALVERKLTEAGNG